MGDLHTYFFYSASTPTTAAAISNVEDKVEVYGKDKDITPQIIGGFSRNQNTNTALETDILERDFCQVRLKNWSEPRKLIFPGSGNILLPVSLPARKNAKWDVHFQDDPGSLDAIVGVHVFYGQPEIPQLSFITSRTVVASSDAGTTPGSASLVNTISDLSPDRYYAILGADLYHEDAATGPQAGYISSPSMLTKPGFPIGDPTIGPQRPYLWPNGAQPIVPGSETISVYAMQGAGAEKPSAIVYFGEISNELEEGGDMMIDVLPTLGGGGGGGGGIFG